MIVEIASACKWDNGSSILRGIIDAAKTCYGSNKGLDCIEVSKKEVDFVNSLIQAGHLTCLMHNSITLDISGVSRAFVTMFLHSMPYYNSEQLSQRYIKSGVEVVDTYNSLYENSLLPLVALNETLLPEVCRKLQLKAGVSNEIIRSCLPLTSTTSLKHTVNLVTILRMITIGQTIKQSPMKLEIVSFAVKLQKELVKTYPLMKGVVDFVLNQYSDGYEIALFKDLYKTSDILKDGKMFTLTNLSTTSTYANNRIKFGMQHRDCLNVSLYEGAESRGSNLYRWDAYLDYASFIQLQRHRAFSFTYRVSSEEYLYPLPPKVLNDKFYLVREVFDAKMEEYKNLVRRRALVTEEVANLLLTTNSSIVYFSMIGTLDSFKDFISTRTCFNAQYSISSFAYIMGRAFSQAVKGFRIEAPCDKSLNTNRCPEGKRYCGTRVWTLSTEKRVEHLNSLNHLQNKKDK